MSELLHGRRRLAFAAVGLLGVAAAGLEPMAASRPVEVARRPLSALRVTSPLDAGPGSLRKAIFAAAAADVPARIRVESARIEISSPLPPLISRHGVTLEGAAGRPVLDDAGLVADATLEVATGDSTLRDLALRGAAGTGILVRAAGVRLIGLQIDTCDEGVVATETAPGLLIEDATFTGNRIGLRLAADPRRVIVRGSRFADHREAAVWAVSPTPILRAADEPEAPPVLELRANAFTGDHIGVVVGNLRAMVADNRFAGQDTAIHLLGGGPAAARGMQVRGNVIRSGRVGIALAEAWNTMVEDNDLGEQAAVAILLKGGGGNLVRANRIAGGGYGIAVLFGHPMANELVGNRVSALRHDAYWVVGGAPVLRGNEARGNGGFGLHVLDFEAADGRRLKAAPKTSDNQLTDNRQGASTRGVYRQSSPAGED